MTIAIEQEVVTTEKKKKKKIKGTSDPVKEVAKKKKKVEEPVAVAAPKVEAPKKKAAPKLEVTKVPSSKLPQAIADKKIVCTSTSSPSIVRVELRDVLATSMHVYVDDIHHLNPTILETNYMMILKNNPYVVVRVTKEVHDEVVQLTGVKLNHHYAAVDCSVIPTLTYGAWKLSEIKGDLPSAKQIAEQDAAFKVNPAYVHNPPVKVELYVEEIVEPVEEEDDAFDFADEEEDDGDFDFGEDEED